ncbi:MAG: hypothetical protein EXX96DRAFT_554441 [Benjaminiella poitrasii]|nr:MAG: hypothetical protein EXX96DRAFT_554441 [Benjaminiella poitrasii]
MSLNIEVEDIHRPKRASHASKVPQKLAQSALFSLKPSTSSLLHNANDKLSTRISQMLFWQRTTSESIIKDTRSLSSQSLDLNAPLGPDIDPGHGSKEKNKGHLSIASRFSVDKGNNQNGNALPSPYSISSPKRINYPSDTTSHDEYNLNPLFSPLSLTNSSTSSFTDSLLSHHITPMPSPLLPFFSVESDATIPIQPTIEEFAGTLSERCSLLLDLLLSNDDTTFSHVREMESILNQTQHLLSACNEPHCAESVNELQQILTSAQNYVQNEIFRSSLTDLKEHVSRLISITTRVKNICITCRNISSDAPSLSIDSLDGFKKELPKVGCSKMTSKDYHELKSDQIDENATWFRCYFVGKPYVTFIGYVNPDAQTSLTLTDPATTTQPSSNVAQRKKKPVSKRRNSKSIINAFLNGHGSVAEDSEGSLDGVIISVIQERAKDFSGPGNVAASILGSQYRIIVRSKESEQSRYVIHECMARDTLSRLESSNEGSKLDKAPPQDKRLRPFISRNCNQTSSSISSQNDNHINTLSSRMLRAAILTVCPKIDLQSFKEMSAESTIMAGLEKELLKYDEIQIPKHYKFGLLSVRDDQSTEEAWFSNTEVSIDLQDFLSIMGKRIELKEYKGYAAGLDTKTGESGKYAYVSRWNEFDILFHVAPLMPSQNNDKQQVLRKKHIGNDIVCIIFLEGNQKFNPKAIRSQFLHVYIIIQPKIIKGKRHWRVEVLRKENVAEFGPALPSPALFDNDETLKEFLTLKLVNAENAALKSNRFHIPNNKARVSLLLSYIRTGLSFHTPRVARSVSTNRLATCKSSPLIKQTNQWSEKASRPKSVNSKLADCQLNGSSRLLREAILDEEKRRRATMSSAAIPPMPSISRSTLLQDFKRGLVSNSRKNKQEGATIKRKTSQLKINDTSIKILDIMDEDKRDRNISIENVTASVLDRVSSDKSSPILPGSLNRVGFKSSITTAISLHAPEFIISKTKTAAINNAVVSRR